MDAALKDEIQKTLPASMPPAEKALATILVHHRLNMQMLFIESDRISADIAQTNAVARNHNAADDDRHYANLGLEALNESLREQADKIAHANISLREIENICADVGPHIKIAADKCYNDVKIKETARV